MSKEQFHTTGTPKNVFLALKNCRILKLLADIFKIPGNRGKS